MMSESFEYAIKKDVINNPIIREVDTARHLQMWRSVVIGALVVVVLMLSAWQHFELLRHGYQTEDLKKALAQEEDINRHLRLEVEALTSLARIQAIAERQLGYRFPGSDEVRVVERVIETPAPPKSVVARR